MVDQNPGNSAYREDLAISHNNLGQLMSRLGLRDLARTEYEQARDIQQRLVDQFPSVPDYRRELAVTLGNLGLLIAELGQRDAARSHYERALDLHRALHEQYPDIVDHRINLAGTFVNLGKFAREGGEARESLAWFGQALDTIEIVSRAEPRDGRVRQITRNSYWGRARANETLKNPEAANHDWERAIESSPPLERPAVQASRATARLEVGRVDEAVQEAATLIGIEGWPASNWYDFACIYSVASSKIIAKQTEYAARAVELLKRAVAAGFQDADHLAKDSDLDPLRERADFQQLADEIQTKAAARK